MANWIDSIRSRKTPNASVEIGYKTAVAGHMANLAYCTKQRVTLAMARKLSLKEALSLDSRVRLGSNRRVDDLELRD